MPYVPLDDRKGEPFDVGQLNYVVSNELNKWIEEYGTRYDTINSIMAFLALLKTKYCLYEFMVVTNANLQGNNQYEDNIITIVHNSVSRLNYSDIVGVLSCVEQEFYRRIASPYEDLKKEENGDVYNV